MNSIPEGFKLVPVEPTDDMIVSFAEAWYSKRQAIDDPDMTDAYRDMLAAAPTPPQPIYNDSKERSACRKDWEQRNKHSHFEPVPFPDYWAGWKDCVQSRAKAGGQ